MKLSIAKARNYKGQPIFKIFRYENNCEDTQNTEVLAAFPLLNATDKKHLMHLIIAFIKLYNTPIKSIKNMELHEYQ